MVERVVSSAPDLPEFSPLFELAAYHPATSVRETVAHKNKLPEAALEKLSHDASVQVVENLLSSDDFRKWASLDLLKNMIQRDPKVAKYMASCINDFRNVEANELAEILVNSEDPDILDNLGGAYSAPRTILKTLAKHPDPSVATTAKRSLE